MSQEKMHLSLGRRIRSLRAEKGVSLKWLSDETGVRIDDLNLIQAGKVIPPVATILQLARALGVDSTPLLKEEEETQTEFHSAEYTYEVLAPSKTKKCMKAFRIVLERKSLGKGMQFQHVGEEFQYVVKGVVQITVGENTFTLKRGGFLHFDSSIPHSLRNIGNSVAELIVVVYSPEA